MREKTACPNEWSLVIAGDLAGGGECIVVDTGPKHFWSVDDSSERVKLTRGHVTIYMSQQDYHRRFTEI